jgi:hypothetical protein
MDNTDSPGRAEARGSNSGDRRSERDIERLPDSAPNVNREIRELIRQHADRVSLIRVRGPRNTLYFEIVFGDRCLRYPLLWSASSKFDRLIAKLGGAQQP